MEKTFITSDNHFFHKAIMKFCSESRMHHTNIDELNAAMVTQWNSQVSDKDNVYCTGDFSLGNANKTAEILPQLNGKLHLIRGNHDHWVDKNSNKQYWRSINQYYMLRYHKLKFVLFHFPIHDWECMAHGAYHLYGHVHGRPTGIEGRCMDVGIDTRTDLGLYELDEIIELLKDKPIRGR